MASFVQNIIWNSVEGFVEAGKRTAGGYAGDALIKAGDMIENGGRSFGDGAFVLSSQRSLLQQAATLLYESGSDWDETNTDMRF